MATRGIQFLDKNGIKYNVRRYEHGAKGALFASKSLGHPLEATIKTLVVELSTGGNIFLLMPGHIEVPLKTLAKQLGVRGIAMADTTDAERITGYRVGGISPFGSRKRLPVYMEKSLLEFDQVAVNAGQRGVILMMSPRDIKKALNASVVTLS